MDNIEKSFSSEENKKTWPFFLMHFFFSASMSIFSLAFKNYLIFTRLIPANDVGNIISMLPIGYIFGLFLCNFITERIKGGIRSTIIFSIIISTFLLGVQIIISELWLLISVRFLYGLFMSLIMPNSINLLSEWQQNNPKKGAQNFINLNNATYAGFTLGLSVGFVLSFTISNELVVLIVSLFITVFTIPLSIMIGKTKGIQKPNIDKKNNNHMEKRKKAELTIIFPIILSWLGIFYVICSRAFYNFTYPYFYYGNGHEDWISMIYLVTIFQYLGSIFAVNYITSKTVLFKKKSFLIGIIVLFLFSLIIVWNHDTWSISVIIGLSGFFFGIISGISQKIMIDYVSTTGSKTYTIINELLIGVGFGVMPLISGYLINWNLWGGITIIFVVLSVLSLITFICSFFITRHINEHTQTGHLRSKNELIEYKVSTVD